jgi:hypothetical protein
MFLIKSDLAMALETRRHKQICCPADVVLKICKLGLPLVLYQLVILRLLTQHKCYSINSTIRKVLIDLFITALMKI